MDNEDDDDDEKQVKVKEEEENDDGKVKEGKVTTTDKEGDQKRDKEEDEVNVTWEHEKEEEEQEVQKELPKINKMCRKRNIIVGWLCSKMLKFSLKKFVSNALESVSFNPTQYTFSDTLFGNHIIHFQLSVSS